MKPIATYVFLQLETTGLMEKGRPAVGISELSLLALNRAHLLQSINGVLPRVQNKLTLCFNPGKEISSKAAKLSGLENALLEYESVFNVKDFNTIATFLKRLREPVCLIGQNGIAFDFPVLKYHFEKLEMQLADNILAADCLYGFYRISKMPNVSTKVAVTCIREYQEDDNCSSPSKRIKVEGERDFPSNCSFSLQKLNENKPEICDLDMKGPKKLSELKKPRFYYPDNKPDKKFTIEAIYERVIGGPKNVDITVTNKAVMAAEIACAQARQFVKWVDENHFYFSDVEAMA